MCRIICHQAQLAADTAAAMDALWNAEVAGAMPPLMTSIDHVVQHLCRTDRLLFRFEDFETQHVLWQRVGPTSAVVQQRQDGALRRVQIFSRGPTGEVWWEEHCAAGISAKDGDDLLGFIVLVSCFARWSDVVSGRGEKNRHV